MFLDRQITSHNEIKYFPRYRGERKIIIHITAYPMCKYKKKNIKFTSQH